LGGYDVRDELQNKKDLVLNEYEVTDAFGYSAQCIRYVERAINYCLTRKIVAFMVQKNIWFSIYFDGDSVENFEASEKIYNNIKLIKVVL
jgi:hypothetical protein